MHILLAYGEGNFTKKLKVALAQNGHQSAILPEGDPPRARYDIILQLARDPAQTAEGTRLLLNKARRDRSRLFLVGWRLDDRLYDEAFRFAQTLIEESLKKGEVEAVILNLGRLFGPEVASGDSGALGHLIGEFSQGNLLTLYGGGEDSDYYLYADDAVEGLTQALTQAKNGENYALSPSVPITSEAAAKLLYELGGGRHEIVFHRGLAAESEKEKVPGKSLPDFQIKTPFHEGIVAILKTAPAAPRAAGWRLPKLRAPLLKLPRLKIPLPKPSRRLVIALVSALIVFSPVIYLGTNAGWGILQLQRAKTLLAQGEFARASKAVSSAAGSLGRLGQIIPPVRPLAETVQIAAEIAGESETLTTALENLVKSRRGEPVEPQGEEDFRQLAAALSFAQNRLALAWLEIQQEDSRLWQPIRTALEPVLEESLRAARLGEALTRDLPKLLGYQGERNYLILFQNSAEARAGGGFLGSLAWLALNEGGISKLQFFDAYDFNREGTSPPPASIAELKGSTGLRFRELNFFASFPTSAQKIAEVFENAQNVKIDGVLGTTLTFAKELLAETGEINLPEFEETVTSENLFEITTREVEQDFFPGTAKKKRFLEALGEALIEKLFSTGRENYPGVAKAAWESLTEKNLLLYFVEGELAQGLYELNFDGHVSPTQGDYLFVLDTSYAKKINEIWLKRRVDYEVKNINRRGTVQATATITWEHTGTDAWPSGTYVNLLRVLVPQGSVLREAELNGKDYFSKMLTTQEAGKTEFAAYLKKIEPQSTSTLKLTYRLPKTLNALDLKTYTLYVQKQPGTVGDGFGFIFEEPFGSEAQSSDLQKQDNKLIFEGNLTQDLEFKINIEER